jgi:multidrug resistance efflux pump
MIVFLTLLYVGLLLLLVKLKVIKLTPFLRLSPVLWMLFLFVVLFIPMQWGAPGGQVRIYHAVVPIVPNVGGMVTEVPAKTLTLMNRGDVLFQIDERPFRYALAQAEAARAKAEADRRLASVEFDRSRALVNRSAGAQRDLDSWTARLQAAEASIALSSAQIDSARFPACSPAHAARGRRGGLPLRSC